MKFIGVIIGSLMSAFGVILLIRNIWRNYRLQREMIEPSIGNPQALSSMKQHMTMKNALKQHNSDPALTELGFGEEQRSEKPRMTATAQRQPKMRQPDVLVLYVLAKKGEYFPGYELLQSVANADLHYGEMNIFHRHQNIDGSGPILFSVAQATEPGTFDIEKLGSVRCAGVTLFMQMSGHPQDLERFELMLATAEQLADDLDGILLDDQRYPVNDLVVDRYRQLIHRRSFDTVLT